MGKGFYVLSRRFWETKSIIGVHTLVRVTDGEFAKCNVSLLIANKEFLRTELVVFKSRHCGFDRLGGPYTVGNLRHE